MAEELWSALGGEGLLSERPWPTWDPEVARKQTVLVVVQVNGKKRATLDVDPAAEKDAITAEAHDHPNVVAQTQGKQVVKTIFVPARGTRNAIVNIVVRPG